MNAKTLAWWLVIVGALNWLLVGLGGLAGGAGWNLVALLFGSVPVLENLVYVVVGLSGVWFVWDKLGGKK
ncbi:MAG: hypothetical protein KatS3mg089_0516 [Patescibacteria group bacterium]|nr:MAG: hypothetical protein KatS3mg089_0516 [Patescibacteria group bacterium]